MTKIAERLKEIRIANRYSQKQIADMCGMAQATIGGMKPMQQTHLPKHYFGTQKHSW